MALKWSHPDILASKTGPVWKLCPGNCDGILFEVFMPKDDLKNLKNNSYDIRKSKQQHQ
jgi:hypothetical protein